MSAIILDSEQKSALAAIRSLGRADIQVVAGAVRHSALGLRSRYATARFVYPDPKVDKASFLVAVKAQAQRLQKETGTVPVLFCFSDATKVAVAESVETMEGAVLFPLPTRDAFRVAFNKEKTAELAKRLGISTIPTHELTEASGLNYPVVIKTPSSVSWVQQHGIFKTAQFIFSANELEASYANLKSTTGSEPIIQACVLGEEYGVELMCRDGEAIATFMHQRIRSLSPTGGASVVKQTAPVFALTEKLLAQSLQLAQALHWNGPMMVEWKVTKGDDTPYLMEINGRFWGSLPLAIAAGIDFPLYYYHLARGEMEKITPPQIATDVRTRHFWGDVHWLLKVFFDQTPLRVTHYPSRLKALWQFLIEGFRSQGDIWDKHDPWPSFYELVDILNRKL